MVSASVCWLTLMMTSASSVGRSEEHTSELQSQSNLVCRLLLEKKKKCYAKGIRYGRAIRSRYYLCAPYKLRALTASALLLPHHPVPPLKLLYHHPLVTMSLLLN